MNATSAGVCPWLLYGKIFVLQEQCTEPMNVASHWTISFVIVSVPRIVERSDRIKSGPPEHELLGIEFPPSFLKRSKLAHDMSEDLASRLECIGTNLEDCDVIHGRILSRLEASLEGVILEIHLQGLGTLRLREERDQYQRWYRTIRGHFADDPTSSDPCIMGLLRDTEDGVSQLRSEWQRTAAMVEQVYPDPNDWDSDCPTLVDPESSEDEDASSTGSNAVPQVTTTSINDNYDYSMLEWINDEME